MNDGGTGNENCSGEDGEKDLKEHVFLPFWVFSVLTGDLTPMACGRSTYSDQRGLWVNEGVRGIPSS